MSLKPLSGMRDFLPEEVRARRHVVRVIEGVYESYGFLPLETPAMESLETLLGKYGDEGDQLVFRLLHRRERLVRALAEPSPGEKELADEGLRYDLTVPLARVVAGRRNELPKFWKRYQIQPVWRADRPAKGRFREFWQCDVDAIGTVSPLAEAEVLSAIAEALRKLGFDGFTIHLNDRRLLRSLIRAAGIEAAAEGSALVALDKLDKIGEAGVEKELAGRGIGAEAAAALLRLSRAPAGAAEREALRSALCDEGKAALDGLAVLEALCADTPAGPALRLTPALARGLGYYTGPIFEVTVPDLAGSLGGGGRYDGLIGRLSGHDVPAVGFSLGLERILVVMAERGMLPPAAKGSEVLVAGFADTPPAALLRVARCLRARGLRVEVYPEPAHKLGKQLQYADQVGAREVAIVGKSELERGVFLVKELAGGTQREERLA